MAINVKRSHLFIWRTRCSEMLILHKRTKLHSQRPVLRWHQLWQSSGGLRAGYHGCGSIPRLLVAISPLVHFDYGPFCKPQIKVVSSGTQKQKLSPLFWAFTWIFSLMYALAVNKCYSNREIPVQVEATLGTQEKINLCNFPLLSHLLRQYSSVPSDIFYDGLFLLSTKQNLHFSRALRGHQCESVINMLKSSAPRIVWPVRLYVNRARV